MNTEQDERWMVRALELAAEAESHGEVPVGAVVVCEGKLVGEGFNQPIRAHDPSAHAEIMALRTAAANVENYRLPGCDLYVTIEPCAMCAGALVHARIRTLVFGAREPRAGAVLSQNRLLDADYMNHKVIVREGVMAGECSALISGFFRQKRQRKDNEGQDN